MKEINGFLQDIVVALTEVKGLLAIVLGGSWASHTQRPDSDIDIGLYYNEETPLDIDHVRKIAQELNDYPNPEVTVLGGWGRWVNGETQFDDLQQPPYGFYSYIYCSETQLCKVIYDPHKFVAGLKLRVSNYSEFLKSTIINNCLWQAEFALEVAKEPANTGDVFFVAGCLTRIASCMVQVLYALNETYFVSDKRLKKDLEQFNLKPQDFGIRLDRMLGVVGRDSKELSEAPLNAKILLSEIIELCRDTYTPKFDLYALSPKSL